MKIQLKKDKIILYNYWKDNFKYKLADIANYVIDFGFLKNGSLTVIELNPFELSDGRLFDNEIDKAITRGSKIKKGNDINEVEFRFVRKISNENMDIILNNYNDFVEFTTWAHGWDLVEQFDPQNN